MREIVGFPCGDDQLAGTLDHGPERTGLLIVSGGKEIRIGAHRGMAMLAARIAAGGFPVFRYDRRGIGDSDGVNHGFLDSADDIAAAAQAFRRCAPIDRLVGFGNCDAASALALFHPRADIDALLLANPWVIEGGDDLPPAAAIRARYAERMRDPGQWLRLVGGGVDIRSLIKGLKKSVEAKDHAADSLAGRIAEALAVGRTPSTILLAERDNTAIAFRQAWESVAFASVRTRADLITRDTASHSFAKAGDAEWLEQRILETLRARS